LGRTASATTHERGGGAFPPPPTNLTPEPVTMDKGHPASLCRKGFARHPNCIPNCTYPRVYNRLLYICTASLHTHCHGHKLSPPAPACQGPPGCGASFQSLNPLHSCCILIHISICPQSDVHLSVHPLDPKKPCQNPWAPVLPYFLGPQDPPNRVGHPPTTGLDPTKRGGTSYKSTNIAPQDGQVDPKMAPRWPI
jgi:hypothetical protein